MEGQDTKGKAIDAQKDGSPPEHPNGHRNEEPPSYDDAHHPPAGTSALPDYSNAGGSSSLSKPSRPGATPLTPYRSFPTYMTLQNIREASLASMRSLHLCGASPTDVLYAAAPHAGYTSTTKPGYVLHNGTDTKAPPLASTGDRQKYFDSSGIIVLPALAGSGKATVEEVLKAGRAADGGVVFLFGVEVGEEKVRREEFEWRKVKRAGSSEAGGYELSRRGATGEGGGSGSGQASDAGGKSGVVAVLAWDRDGSLLNRKREFILELTGSGKSEALGQRWRLMVVMTALRLSWLHVQGRTTRVGITIQEKLRGKEK